jgi:hypothetical protein
MNRQPKLNLYGKGIYKTDSGHLRYHSPRDKKGKYVHREIIEKLIEQTPYSIRLLLPWPYEVHHQDYNKEHNCGANLLIIGEALHSIMTADRPRQDGGRFGRKFIPNWTNPPQYVLDLQDEVPF